jgi:flagellar assembly protein FliH
VERHPFDGSTRITGKDLDAASVHAWLPPLIDKAGHLVQALPRDERRGPPPAPKTHAEKVAEGYQEGFQKGRIEGIAEGRREGMEQGQREGHEKGLQQGQAKGQREFDERFARLDELMKHVAHAINEQDYTLEQALLNLVIAVARPVIGRELTLDSRHILGVVRQALAALPPSRDNVRIFVNPADVAMLNEAKERTGDAWRVLPDEQLAKGGCRIETEQSLVDYTVERRFALMVEQLLDKQLLESGVPEAFEVAPEPLVKRRTPEPESLTPAPSIETVTAHADEDDEPGLLEQVEFLRKGVPMPALGLRNTGT